MTRIAVVGTGYVGLTTGACFAHIGHDVVCADIDAAKVERLQRGEISIVEHRLDDLVRTGLDRGNLRFVLGAANAVTDAEVVFLCVPTPQGDDGSADLSYVEAAAREIAASLPYECIVVNKSTVPVGSTTVVERVLQRPDVRVVSNPEFLREGSAVDDFLNPDRVVVGCNDRSAAITVGALSANFSEGVLIYGNESGAYNFAAQAVEVEVDPGTGRVTVLEIAAAVDCGTVIHPAAAEGQVQGAVTQGLGLALTEYFDWYNGTPTDPNLKDYPLPSAAMMPKLHVAFADSYEPSGPFGAKGLGEIGLDAIPAAIANAIADAVGVRITELPITSEKIYRALHPEAFAAEKPLPAAAPKGSVWTRLTAGRPSGARSQRR